MAQSLTERRQKAIRALAAGMGLDEHAAATRLQGELHAGTTTRRVCQETDATTDAERDPRRLSDLDFGDDDPDGGDRHSAGAAAISLARDDQLITPPHAPEKITENITTTRSVFCDEPVYVTDSYFESQLIQFLGQAYVDVDPRRSIGDRILGGFLKECLQWAMTYLKWRETEPPPDIFPASVDLVREYEEALAATPERALEPLRQVGVTQYSLELARPAAVKFSLFQGGLFQFDPEHGRDGFVVPVRIDPDAATPDLATRDGTILDLVAFTSNPRSGLALRYGAADWLGNYADVATPVRLHPTPIDWLRADCCGLVCLAQTSAEMRHLISRFPKVDTEDANFAGQLRQLISRPTTEILVQGKIPHAR